MSTETVTLTRSQPSEPSLLKKLENYQSPPLLVCDKIGYLSVGQQKKGDHSDDHFALCRRGNVFDSTTVATAITDRLVQRSEVFILEGTSYRRKPR